jgi:hypothetical protein
VRIEWAWGDESVVCSPFECLIACMMSAIASSTKLSEGSQNKRTATTHGLDKLFVYDFVVRYKVTNSKSLNVLLHSPLHKT